MNPACDALRLAGLELRGTSSGGRVAGANDDLQQQALAAFQYPANEHEQHQSVFKPSTVDLQLERYRRVFDAGDIKQVNNSQLTEMKKRKTEQ
jgi:hypothetical protein